MPKQIRKYTAAGAALLLLLMGSVRAMAESKSALDAFQELVNSQTQEDPSDPAAGLLGQIMAGKYAAVPADMQAAAEMAQDLDPLCGITNKDLAAFAAENEMSLIQVRNAYYTALAHVLEAQIRVNPSSVEKYANIQTILLLFLKEDTNSMTAEDVAAKKQIRESLTSAQAQEIADVYDVPDSFVEFVILNPDWQDPHWVSPLRQKEAQQDPAQEAAVSASIGDRDHKGEDLIAGLQRSLIHLGYLKGEPDGVFGARTQRSLLEFQLANGLRVTGVYTIADALKMKDDDVVARWDYGNAFWDPEKYDDGYYDDWDDDDDDDWDDDDDDDSWDDDDHDDDDWDDDD